MCDPFRAYSSPTQTSEYDYTASDTQYQHGVEFSDMQKQCIAMVWRRAHTRNSLSRKDSKLSQFQVKNNYNTLWCTLINLASPLSLFLR